MHVGMLVVLLFGWPIWNPCCFTHGLRCLSLSGDVLGHMVKHVVFEAWRGWKGACKSCAVGTEPCCNIQALPCKPLRLDRLGGIVCVRTHLKAIHWCIYSGQRSWTHNARPVLIIPAEKTVKQFQAWPKRCKTQCSQKHQPNHPSAGTRQPGVAGFWLGGP